MKKCRQKFQLETTGVTFLEEDGSDEEEEERAPDGEMSDVADAGPFTDVADAGSLPGFAESDVADAGSFDDDHDGGGGIAVEYNDDGHTVLRAIVEEDEHGICKIMLRPDKADKPPALSPVCFRGFNANIQSLKWDPKPLCVCMDGCQFCEHLWAGPSPFVIISCSCSSAAARAADDAAADAADAEMAERKKRNSRSSSSSSQPPSLSPLTPYSPTLTECMETLYEEEEEYQRQSLMGFPDDDGDEGSTMIE